MILKKIKYYESIEELPLYNFDKYWKSKNNNWFIVGFDDRQKNIKNEKLKQLEVSLIDEYFIAVDDLTFKKRLKNWAKIDTLRAKYNVILAMVSAFSSGFENTDKGQKLRYRYIETFKDNGFKLPIINTVAGDIEECHKILHKAGEIKTKIRLIELSMQEDSKKDTINLFKQLKMAEIGLDLGYKIDAKQTSVAEWIEITKLMQEKAQQN